MGEEGRARRVEELVASVPRLSPHSSTPGSGGRLISIGTKLGLSVVLVVALATAAAFFWVTARERDALVDAKRKAADMVADLFSATLGAPLDFGDEDAVKAELQHIGQNRDVTRAVVFQAGRAQAFAEFKPGPDAAPVTRENPGTKVLSDRVEVVRQVRNVEGKDVGLAVVHFSLARENAAFAASRKRVLFSCLIVALGSMMMLLVVTRRQVVVPIDRLLNAARRLERGERGVRVGVLHRDEIGRLARAFEAMDAAIADREQRLARAHESLRELFDHMRQAIVVFSSDGRVVGAQSRQATRVFGRDALEGVPVRELLYPDAGGWDAELRAFDDWSALAFESSPDEWSDVASFAPPEARLAGPEGERVLKLEFRPITSEGRVQRIMLLATDDTERVRLEREVAVQGERHARQMAAMRRLVSAGGQQFVRFLEGARRRLARASELSAGRSELSGADFNECFGLVHTLRGEARVFGLDDLAAATESLEVVLSEIRNQAAAAGSAAVSLAGRDVPERLTHASSLVDEAERLFVEASPTGRAALEQTSVRRPDLEALCALAAERGGELARLAERLSARGLGELAAPLSESVPRWAEALNKRARLEIEGREALIPERLASVLGGSLTHLAKNAVAHGIEPPEERERSGKPSIGLVRITATSEGGGLATLVTIEDDGAGFAENPLLAAAAAAGAPLASAGRSFRALPPSDDAEHAGRGVGLSAVVRDLEVVGFAISIQKRPSGGTRFSIAPRSSRVEARVEASS